MKPPRHPPKLMPRPGHRWCSTCDRFTENAGRFGCTTCNPYLTLLPSGSTTTRPAVALSHHIIPRIHANGATPERQ